MDEDAQGEGGFSPSFPIEARPETRYEDRAVDDVEYADLSGIRVLVVEDDADALDMLVDVLLAQGAEARGTANGVDAVDLVRSFRPDVLVSDIGLPDMDGYALIRKVRGGSSPFARVPALAVTAYASPEDARRAKLAGLDVHLAKPVELACQ